MKLKSLQQDEYVEKIRFAFIPTQVIGKDGEFYTVWLERYIWSAYAVLTGHGEFCYWHKETRREL